MAVDRVVAIDVIHLLKAEGNYSQSVESQLQESEVWQAYSRQRHDLFLPAAGDSQVDFCNKAHNITAPRFFEPET